LAECLDRFWSAGDLDALRVRPRAAEVPDALLRQLDPPAVDVAGRDLAELLAPAYRILTVAAERRALAEDTG
jgi:hypothetical protein